jgi:hypothetical protein
VSRDYENLRAEAAHYRALLDIFEGSTMRSALEDVAAALDRLADEAPGGAANEVEAT